MEGSAVCELAHGGSTRGTVQPSWQRQKDAENGTRSTDRFRCKVHGSVRIHEGRHALSLTVSRAADECMYSLHNRHVYVITLLCPWIAVKLIAHYRLRVVEGYGVYGISLGTKPIGALVLL